MSEERNDILRQMVEHSRLLREKYLADRTRPGYHFAIPEDFGVPGDVNCCFYARGRYHLMYLYDCAAQELITDLEHSDMGSWKIGERAPLAVAPGEKLKLDIFLDRAVVEVFANKRQAICRRVYTVSAESVGMEIIAEGGELKKKRGWDMMPSNMY